MPIEAAKAGRSKRRSVPEEPGADRTPGWKLFVASGWVQGLALFVLTVLVYLPSLGNGFVWDDDLHVTNNLITKADGLWKSWFTAEQPNYWPVTWSAFWLEWRLFGRDATGYHAVNVLVHAANCLLAWRVLVRLGVPGAWLGALLFAVHPVGVETAAWITQLKTLISMFFFLTSLLAFLRWEDGEGSNRRLWYGASLALFLVGMLAKPQIVTLPAVLLGMAWFRRGRIGRSDLARSAPFFAIAAVLSATEIWFQYTQSIAGADVRSDGLVSRLAGAGWAAGFYLMKAVWPWNLMAIYPRWTIDPASALAWAPGLALLAGAALAWAGRRGAGRPVLAGLGFFVVTLTPVLGFLNIYYMRYSYVADHYQYVSLLGVTALAAGLGTWAAGRTARAGRLALAGCGAAAAAVFAWQSVELQRGYKDAETFYRHALAGNPDAFLARNNLGHLLLGRGDLDEAWTQFTEARRIQPDYAESHANLASVLAARGQVEEAMPHFRKAGELAGDIFELHNRLGETYLRLGKTAEATAEFERALALEPKCAAAYDGLGVLAMRRGDAAGAAKQFGKAVAAAPRFARGWEHLAEARLKGGDAAGAFEAYRTAIRAIPESPQLRNNLAATLAGSGRVDEAIGELRVAAARHPDFAATYKNLGALLAGQGKTDEAREELGKALRLDPGDREARAVLEGIGGG